MIIIIIVLIVDCVQRHNHSRIREGVRDIATINMHHGISPTSPVQTTLGTTTTLQWSSIVEHVKGASDPSMWLCRHGPTVQPFDIIILGGL